MATTTSHAALDEFERIRPDCIRFTAKLEILFRDLLRARAIDVHLIESRTKETTSLRDKLTRSAKTYEDPLRQVADLVGIRVITYYQDEADSVSRLIEEEFVIDKENSVVHSSAAAEFGYRSTHFVVRLSQGRSGLLEWSGWGEFKVEVQVRTVLQHAWAAISHKLQYKREEDVPLALKRKLFRLSALFELADDEFVSLRDASGNVTKQISEAVALGGRELPLDYVSLSRLLETSHVVAELCALAAEAGFDFDPDAPEPEEDRDGVSDLIQLAGVAGFTTIEEIERILDGALPWARKYLEAQYNADRRATESDVSTWYATPPFVCELMLIRLAIDKVRLGHLLRLGFAREIGTRVYDVAKQFSTEV